MSAFTRRLIVFSLALLAALLVVALVRVATMKPGEGGGAAAIGGAFTAVNQDGQTVGDRSYRGKLQLVFFGYTFCPDVCPTELQNITLALDELEEKERAQVAPLFFSVDPERDTPAVLKEYLTNFAPSIQGLTGTPEQIRANARTFKAYYAKVPPKEAGGDYLMDHSAFTYLLDREGRYVQHFRPGAAPDEIARAIRARL